MRQGMRCNRNLQTKLRYAAPPCVCGVEPGFRVLRGSPNKARARVTRYNHVQSNLFGLILGSRRLRGASLRKEPAWRLASSSSSVVIQL